MRWIKKENLKPLLKRWSEKFQVLAPVEDEGTTLLLPYDEDKFTLDYINFALPVKESLFEQKEKIFEWKNVNGNIETSSPKETDFNKRFCLGFAHVTPMVLLIWIDFI